MGHVLNSEDEAMALQDGEAGLSSDTRDWKGVIVMKIVPIFDCYFNKFNSNEWTCTAGTSPSACKNYLKSGSCISFTEETYLPSDFPNP